MKSFADWTQDIANNPYVKPDPWSEPVVTPDHQHGKNPNSRKIRILKHREWGDIGEADEENITDDQQTLDKQILDELDLLQDSIWNHSDWRKIPLNIIPRLKGRRRRKK